MPTPSPAGYQPSPGAYGTPSPMNYSPMTPGAQSPFIPQTPGAGIEHMSAQEWHTTDIEVRIRDTHEDVGLVGQTGVIRGVSVSVFTFFSSLNVIIENFIINTTSLLTGRDVLGFLAGRRQSCQYTW